MVAVNQAIAGAELEVQSNGSTIGFATGLRWNQDIDQFPVEVLGDMDVKEHIPTRRRVGFSLSFIRIRRSSLGSQGIFPRGDTATMLTFPTQTWTLVSVIDPELVLATLEKVSLQGRSGTVDANSVVMSDCSGVAIRLLDEDGKG